MLTAELLQPQSLGESPNLSQLKSIEIKGLFGHKDIKIPFDQGVKILIGENGSGKTIILAILYYTLTYQFDKLAHMDFESVEVEFSFNQTLAFNQDDLESFRAIPILDELEPFIPQVTSKRLRRYVQIGHSIQHLERELLKCIERYALPIELVQKIHVLKDKNNGRKNNRKLLISQRHIEKSLQDYILYMPTYRRIEKDLYGLGFDEKIIEQLKSENCSGNLMNFGMSDIVRKISQIESAIERISSMFFPKVTGGILSQFLGGNDVTDEMRQRVENLEYLSSVFQQIGEDNLSLSDRQKIESLIASGEIRLSKHDPLVHFLSELIDWNHQIQQETAGIKSFVAVCNRYLAGKQFVYHDKDFRIVLVQNKSKNEIDLGTLSSGEKQIVSLFFKIYMEASQNFILLIDEPEMSLSIEWQRLLLPDIMKSKNCKLIIATTHSPFIFDNELDSYAHDLNTFVSEP
ncbi:MAG: AAA family ATPase [Cyanobacteria bacterium P01_F01_bin.150]